MQVASMKPATVVELLEQQYIRNPDTSIKDLVKETAGILGENIVVARFTRMAVGENAAPISTPKTRVHILEPQDFCR